MPRFTAAPLHTALLAAGLLLVTDGDGNLASAAAAEKQIDPLSPTPLEGPIPTLREAQQRLAGEEKEPDLEVALLLKPPTSRPLRSVRLLSATLRKNPELPQVYGMEYGLALETVRGWFLLRHYGSRGRNGALEDSLGTPKCWLETTARIGGVEVVRCEVAYEATDRLYNGSDKPR